MKNRRVLLVGISCALPFLGFRMLYATPLLILNGDRRIYLVIMEYIVAVVYTTAGAKIPLQQDHHLNSNRHVDGYLLRNGQPQTGYVPPKEQTPYDPESQTPYRTQERLVYAPSPLPPP